MNLPLVIMIGLLVAASALAFWMDWLGLWVSPDQMKAEVARAKARAQQPG